MTRMIRAVGLGAVLAAAPAPTDACPVCASPGGRELRGRLFGETFPRDLALVGASAVALFTSGFVVERALCTRGRAR
jgi:hypothetical protein